MYSGRVAIGFARGRANRDNGRLARTRGDRFRRRIADFLESSMASSSIPTPPAGGARISKSASGLTVPDRPIIPFIEGDGTGPDIWRASVRVLDAAVAKAYGGKRKIE